MKWIGVFIWIGLGLCGVAHGTAADSAAVRAQLVVEQEAQALRIARQVARGVLDVQPGDSLTAAQETLVARVSGLLMQDAEVRAAEKARDAAQKAERRERIRSIVLNVAKGIAIVIALLVLRAVIGSIGKGVRAEHAATPLGVLINAPTEADALTLGRTLVQEGLASGGTVSPEVRSLYRRDNAVRDATEAVVMLKTTNGQLKGLVDRAEELCRGGVPEIVALSRSMVLDVEG